MIAFTAFGTLPLSCFTCGEVYRSGYRTQAWLGTALTARASDARNEDLEGHKTHMTGSFSPLRTLLFNSLECFLQLLPPNMMEHGSRCLQYCIIKPITSEAWMHALTYLINACKA